MRAIGPVSTVVF